MEGLARLEQEEMCTWRIKAGIFEEELLFVRRELRASRKRNMELVARMQRCEERMAGFVEPVSADKLIKISKPRRLKENSSASPEYMTAQKAWKNGFWQREFLKTASSLIDAEKED